MKEDEYCDDCEDTGYVIVPDKTITYSCHGEYKQVPCKTCNGGEDD